MELYRKNERRRQEMVRDKSKISKVTGRKLARVSWSVGVRVREQDREIKTGTDRVVSRALTGVKPWVDPSSSAGICELGSRNSGSYEPDHCHFHLLPIMPFSEVAMRSCTGPREAKQPSVG